MVARPQCRTERQQCRARSGDLAGAKVAIELVRSPDGSNIVLKLNDRQTGLFPASVTGVRRPSDLDAVEPSGGSAEQGCLLAGGGACGDVLERVPHVAVAGRDAVDREIAFEHASLDPECRDAGLEPRPPGFRQTPGRVGLLAVLEPEAAERHAEST